MRLIRYRQADEMKIGVVEDESIQELRLTDDTTDVPPIVQAATTSPEKTGSERDRDGVTVQAPVSRPSKIVCLGLNYAEHAERGGNEIPETPLLFAKPTSAIIGPDEPIVYPTDVEQLDYEAELAIVIGRRGRRIPRSEAMDYVAGYTAFNDVSARDVQYRYSQYFRGKGYDTFAPIGPVLATKDELDPSELSIRTFVNGELRQDSSTADMIFSVEEIVESVSGGMTLYPGDVIATGTPPGVGVHRDPPLLLSEGDEVTVELGRIGELTNPIIGEE